MQRSVLCRSRRALSNAYLLAKFRFDKAENEPYKVCRIRPRGAAGAGGARGWPDHRRGQLPSPIPIFRCSVQLHLILSE